MKNTTMTVIKGALERTGLNWSIEAGKRHHLVRIEGQLIAILKNGREPSRGRGLKNVMAAIKRAPRLHAAGMSMTMKTTMQF